MQLYDHIFVCKNNPYYLINSGFFSCKTATAPNLTHPKCTLADTVPPEFYMKSIYWTHFWHPLPLSHCRFELQQFIGNLTRTLTTFFSELVVKGRSTSTISGKNFCNFQVDVGKNWEVRKWDIIHNWRAARSGTPCIHLHVHDEHKFRQRWTDISAVTSQLGLRQFLTFWLLHSLTSHLA